ncbi:MAG: hypothetical protein WBV82_16250 [Myxococcaceae bacterium]
MSVQLELDTNVVEAGDELSGVVQLGLAPEKRAKAKAVTVRLFAVVHGAGNTEEAPGDEVRIPVEPGSGDRFRFTLKSPKDGPVTYRGPFIKIDWVVRAEVDLPWDLDPNTQKGVGLLPRRRSRDAAVTRG